MDGVDKILVVENKGIGNLDEGGGPVVESLLLLFVISQEWNRIRLFVVVSRRITVDSESVPISLPSKCRYFYFVFDQK